MKLCARRILPLVLPLVLLVGCSDIDAFTQCREDEDCGAGNVCSNEGLCVSQSVEGQNAGECSDEADNDLDGLFDCDDPDCAAAPNCQGDDDDDATGDDDDDSGGDDDDDATGDDDDATGDDDDDSGDDDDSAWAGSELCSAAGRATNGTYTAILCTGPVELGPGVSTNGDYTLVTGALSLVNSTE